MSRVHGFPLVPARSSALTPACPLRLVDMAECGALVPCTCTQCTSQTSNTHVCAAPSPVPAHSDRSKEDWTATLTNRLILVRSNQSNYSYFGTNSSTHLSKSEHSYARLSSGNAKRHQFSHADFCNTREAPCPVAQGPTFSESALHTSICFSFHVTTFRVLILIALKSLVHVHGLLAQCNCTHARTADAPLIDSSRDRVRSISYYRFVGHKPHGPLN